MDDDLKDIKPGHPAIDAMDVPRWSDGRYCKKVILVCPRCDVAGIYITDPDTTQKFGDFTDECQSCGLGHEHDLDVRQKDDDFANMAYLSEEAEIAGILIRSAVDVPVAWLDPCILSDEADAEKTDPFEVEFFWGEPGFGVIATTNIREEMLDAFADDPVAYRAKILATAKAMRDFADELDRLGNAVPGNPSVQY